MAQISKLSAQYLMSQYAFSRMMDAADERFFPITDETMEQVRSSMLGALGDGSESVFCRQNMMDGKSHGPFADAFLDGMRSAYAAKPDVLQELSDGEFREELVRKCGESGMAFSKGFYSDRMLVLSNAGIPKPEIKDAGAFRDAFSRETVAVDMEDLDAFFPDKTMIQNVGGYKGDERSPGQLDFWQAVARCPLYRVDPVSQEIDKGTVAHSGLLKSKWNKPTDKKQGSGLDIREYFSGNVGQGAQRRREEEAAARKAAIEAMAEKARQEPELPDRYYIAAYGRWKNDPLKVPVPNTRTGCFIEPHKLKLSERAGQCWCAQHAFGRMMDMAEQHIFGNSESKFKEKFVVAIRNRTISKLSEQGMKFDELYLCHEDIVNDCDMYADAVADAMSEQGFTADKYPGLRNKLRKGVDMGYSEFSKEFLDPMYIRPFMILNTRGMSEGYKKQVPAFRGYRAVVGVYVDEIADRFPDAEWIYSPLDGRTPDGEVEFTTMLSHTPVYDLRRLRGRRYITQESVFEGSPPGPVQPSGLRLDLSALKNVTRVTDAPKRHDVSDMQVDSVEADTEPTLWRF